MHIKFNQYSMVVHAHSMVVHAHSIILTALILLGLHHYTHGCLGVNPNLNQQAAFSDSVANTVATMLNSESSAGLAATKSVTTIGSVNPQGRIVAQPVNIAGLVEALKAKKLCSNEFNDGSVFANKEGRLPNAKGGVYHEFRVTDNGANGMRAVVFVPDQLNPAEPAKMFVTGDHYSHFTTYDNNFGQFFPVKDFVATDAGKKAVANPALYRKAVVEQYPALGIEYAAFRQDFAKRFPPLEPAHMDVQSKMDEIRKAYLNKLSDPKSVQQLDLKDANLRNELGLTDKYNDGTFVATEYKISPQRSYRIIGPKDITENVTPANSLIFQGNSDGRAPLTWEKIKGVILCRRGIYARLRARQLGAVFCGGRVEPRKRDPKEPSAETPTEPLPEKKFKPSVKDSKSVKLDIDANEARLANEELSRGSAKGALAVKTLDSTVARWTGSRILGAVGTLAVIGFDIYGIVEACHKTDNLDERECWTSVIVMGLDIASLVGCAIAAGPLAGVACSMAVSMLVAPFAAGMVNFSADLGQGVANGFALWEQGNIGDGFKAIASGLANGLKDGLSAFATKLVPLLQAAQLIQGRPIRTSPISTVLNAQSHYILTLLAEMRLSLMSTGYQFIQVVQHCESFIFKSTFRSDSILLAQSEFGPLDVPVKSCYIGQAVETYSIKILKTKDGSPEECQDAVVPDKKNLNVGVFSKTIDQCKGVAAPIIPQPLGNGTITPPPTSSTLHPAPSSITPQPSFSQTLPSSPTPRPTPKFVLGAPPSSQPPCGVNPDGSLKEGISDTFNYSKSVMLGKTGIRELCLVSLNRQHYVKYELQPTPEFSIVNFNGTVAQVVTNFKADHIKLGFKSIYFSHSASQQRIAQTKDWSRRHCNDNKPICVPPPGGSCSMPGPCDANMSMKIQDDGNLVVLAPDSITNEVVPIWSSLLQGFESTLCLVNCT